MGSTSVIVEGILLIAAVVAASVFATTFLTRIGEIKDSFAYSMKANVAKVKTKVVITYTTYNDSANYFVIYVKNVGQYTVSPISEMDIYFGTLGKASLYNYDKDGILSPGEWDYVEISGKKTGVWELGETIEIRVLNASTINPPYYVKIVLPCGVSAEEIFSKVPR